MAGELVCISLFAGETGTTLSTNYLHTIVPFSGTIVGVCASTNVDDANITVDVNIGGSTAIAAIAVTDQDAPGSWLSTHLGGTNAPVAFAADAEISLDANNADANTAVTVQIYILVGSLT